MESHGGRKVFSNGEFYISCLYQEFGAPSAEQPMPQTSWIGHLTNPSLACCLLISQPPQGDTATPPAVPPPPAPAFPSLDPKCSRSLWSPTQRRRPGPVSRSDPDQAQIRLAPRRDDPGQPFGLGVHAHQAGLKGRAACPQRPRCLPGCCPAWPAAPGPAGTWVGNTLARRVGRWSSRKPGRYGACWQRHPGSQCAHVHGR